MPSEICMPLSVPASHATSYALPLALQSFLPPPIMAPLSLCLLADFGCFLGIKRRILEYPLGTRVICEQPDRAAVWNPLFLLII